MLKSPWLTTYAFFCGSSTLLALSVLVRMGLGAVNVLVENRFWMVEKS